MQNVTLSTNMQRKSGKMLIVFQLFDLTCAMLTLWRRYGIEA